MKRLVATALVGLLARTLSAQLPAPQAGAPAIRLSGEFGSFGEVYSRIGTPGRRPGETGRVYLNANAVLFGSVTVGVDLLATTEDRTSLGYGGLPGRQSISQLGLHPEWSWGRGHLGSVRDSYTPLTYDGVQLTGAAFDIHPGRLHLGAFGGRAAGAVAGGATTGSYKRTIGGGRIGFGRQRLGRPSTFFDLTVLGAWDDPHSLAAVDTTLPPNAPTSGGTAPVNGYAVTPEENLVVSGTGGLALLQGKLAWRGELAGAVHTRDVRATELDPGAADVPGIVRGLITPRVGTNADYAYFSALQIQGVRLPGATTAAPRSLTASLDYRYIGPGYASLGVASLGSDLRAIGAKASLRFARWTAQIQAGSQHDNLLGQKLHTTTRTRLGGTLALRVSRVWNATLRANLLTMGNGSADTLQWMDYTAWSLGVGQAFAFGPRRRVELLSLDYTYQDAGDANPRRASTLFSAHVATARLTIRLAPGFQLTPSVGITRSQSDTAAPRTRATYGVGGAGRLWGGRLTATGSVGRSTYSRSNTWTGVFGSRAQLTTQDDLVLNVQFNRFRDTAGASSWFNERTVSLRWARRF
jgi:hypothetical protein